MESNGFLYVYDLVQDYLRHVSHGPEFEPAFSKPAQVLRKTASSLQDEVEGNLKPYLDSLELSSVDDARRIFGQVMESEFADGQTNWGRILTIFLFGGILTKKLQGCGVALTKENLEQISRFMTEYIVNTKAKWIDENGGWDNGFVTRFEDKGSWLSLHNVKSKVMAVFSFFSQYY